MLDPGKQKARFRLDERLDPLRPSEAFTAPSGGWIKTIRKALGMTSRQFAARLGVKPQSVTDMETSEARETIQLKTLRTAAAALDCTLVYALVPNRRLTDDVAERARRLAERELAFVEHTMELEDQRVSTARDEHIADYIREAITEKRLWEIP